MLDHYLWGDVYRISPEAPVPVVHATRDTYSAGGAANVALNLANLGVSVSLMGYFADDEAGTRLIDILNTNKVSVIRTKHNSTAPTIIKTRVIVRNQQLCRIDREDFRDNYQLDKHVDFLALLDEALAAHDAVIISDYAKGVITQSLVNSIISKSTPENNLLVAIDPKPSHKLAFRGAGLLTPNRHEALEMAGITLLQPGDPYPLEQICSHIFSQYAPRMLVITLGAEGMALCIDGKVVKRLPTDAREVFDVSGAGDTVIATLTAALAAGYDLLQAATLANGAAGTVVAHMGTVPVKMDELKKWLHDRTLNNLAN